jgi:hypothetical protein
MNQRSWYARLLRLRHIDLNGYLGLVLSEGSIVVALLFVCVSDLTVWSVIAIPATIAVMVKYFDVITDVLARPAAAARLRPARPQVAVGRSPVPGPSRPTTWIDTDAAPRPPVARVAVGLVARGVASVAPAGGPRPAIGGRRPSPRARREEVVDPEAGPAPAENEPGGDEQSTGALTYNTAAMRMRGNQGRFS